MTRRRGDAEHHKSPCLRVTAFSASKRESTIERFSLSKQIALIFATLLLLSSPAYSQTKLLRFPDIRGDRVVFTYAGDLWTAPASGGSAVHLTTHPGVEVFGKFSPDGKWIAFTGQYDGDEQVYVVPTPGGEPRQHWESGPAHPQHTQVRARGRVRDGRV